MGIRYLTPMLWALKEVETAKNNTGSNKLILSAKVILCFLNHAKDQNKNTKNGMGVFIKNPSIK